MYLVNQLWVHDVATPIVFISRLCHKCWFLQLVGVWNPSRLQPFHSFWLVTSLLRNTYGSWSRRGDWGRDRPYTQGVHGDYCNWTVAIFLGWFTMNARSVECFYSRGQQLCKFIGTKESFYIRKSFNTKRIGLEDQHGRRFIVLVQSYGGRDVFSYQVEWILEYNWEVERWPL